MLITEMERQSSIALISRVCLGRLACSLEGQPYITPMFWVAEGNYLYSFSTVGKKIIWMRQNPLVCIEFEEVLTGQSWATVIVQGRYEELPDTPEHKESRNRAYALLSTKPAWWEPGYAKTDLDGGTRPLAPLYLRVQIDQVSGHHTDTAAAAR